MMIRALALLACLLATAFVAEAVLDPAVACEDGTSTDINVVSFVEKQQSCATLGNTNDAEIVLEVTLQCVGGTGSGSPNLVRGQVLSSFLPGAGNTPGVEDNGAQFVSTLVDAFELLVPDVGSIAFHSWDAPAPVAPSPPDSPNVFTFFFDAVGAAPGQLATFAFEQTDNTVAQLDILLGGTVQSGGINTQCFNNGAHEVDFTVTCNSQPVDMASAVLNDFFATQGAIGTTTLHDGAADTGTDLLSTTVQPTFSGSNGDYTFSYSVDPNEWQWGTSHVDTLEACWLVAGGTAGSSTPADVVVQSPGSSVLDCFTQDHTVNGVTDVSVDFEDTCPKVDIVWTITASCTDATGSYPVAITADQFFGGTAAGMWVVSITDEVPAAVTTGVGAYTGTAGVYTMTITADTEYTSAAEVSFSLGTFTLSPDAGFAQEAAAYTIAVALEANLEADATRCFVRNDAHEWVLTLTCAADGSEVNIASLAELSVLASETQTATNGAAYNGPFASISGGVATYTTQQTTAPTSTPASLDFSVDINLDGTGSVTFDASTTIFSITNADVVVPEAVCPNDDVVLELDLSCTDASLLTYQFDTVTATQLHQYFDFTFSDAGSNTVAPTSEFVSGGVWQITFAGAAPSSDSRGEHTTIFDRAAEFGLSPSYSTTVGFSDELSSLVPEKACTAVGQTVQAELTLVCANGEPFVASGADATAEFDGGLEVITPSATITTSITSLGNGVFNVLPDSPPGYGVFTYEGTTFGGVSFEEEGQVGVSATASSLAPPEKACLGSTLCVDLELVCLDGVTPVTGLELTKFMVQNLEISLVNTNDPSSPPSTTPTVSAGAEDGEYQVCYTPLAGEPLPDGPGGYELVIREPATGSVVALRQATEFDYYNEFTYTQLSLVTNDPNNVPQGVPGVPMDFFVCVRDCADQPVTDLTEAAFPAFFTATATTPSGDSVEIDTSSASLTAYDGCFALEFTPPVDPVELGVYTIEVETAGGCGVGSVPVLVAGPPCEDVFTFEIDWADFRDSCMEPVRLENGGAWAVYYGVLTMSYTDIVEVTTVSTSKEGARGVPTEVERTNQFQRQFAIRFQRLLDVSSAEVVIEGADGSGSGNGVSIQSALTYVEFDELTEALTFVVDTWTPFPFSLGDAAEQAYVDFPSLVQSGTVVGTGPEWTVTKVDGECTDGAFDDQTTCQQTTFIRVRPEAQGGQVGWSECDWLNLSSGRIPKITWSQPLQCRATDGEPSSCGAQAYPAAEWDSLDFDFTLDLAFVNFCAEISDISVRAASVEVLTEEGGSYPSLSSTVTSSPLNLVGPAGLFDTIVVRATVEAVDPDATLLSADGSAIDDVAVQAYYTGEGAASCQALAGDAAGAPIFIRRDGVNQLGAALASDVAASGALLVFDQTIVIDPATFASQISSCNVAYGIELTLLVDHENDGVAKRAVATATVFAATDVQIVPPASSDTDTDGNQNGGLSSTAAILAAVGSVVAAVAIAAIVVAVVVARKRSQHVQLVDEESSFEQQFETQSASL